MAKITYEETGREGIPWSTLVELATQDTGGSPKDVIVQTHGGRVQRITRIVVDGNAVFVTLTN